MGTGRVALEAEIAAVLNRYSQENGSNTPDWVLANYLLKCLAAFNEATVSREQWYGRPGSHEVGSALAHATDPAK